MKLLQLAVIALMIPLSTFARVEVYVGPSSEILYIQEASDLGKDAYLIKFTGIKSSWVDKAFKTTNNSSIHGLRLAIDYELELSSGNQKRTYGVVAEAGTVLVNGSEVKKMELQIPGRRDTIKLHYSAEKSQNDINLAADFAKTPFNPEP